MILVVDAGNSRIKWAYAESDVDSPLREDHSGQAFYGSPNQRAELLEKTLKTAWHSQPEPGRVVVGNVAGEGVETTIKAWVNRYWRLQPEFVRSQGEGWGVTNAYKCPSELGVDRWLGMVAARSKTKEACGIVDAGTAVTIDGFTNQGQHIGGVIMPGLSLMRRSLLEHTSEILAAEGPQTLGLATDTATAVVSGTSFALVAGIKRALEILAEAMGERPTLYITGGDASFIGAALEGKCIVDPDLVLKGLVTVARDKS